MVRKTAKNRLLRRVGGAIVFLVGAAATSVGDFGTIASAAEKPAAPSKAAVKPAAPTKSTGKPAATSKKAVKPVASATATTRGQAFDDSLGGSLSAQAFDDAFLSATGGDSESTARAAGGVRSWGAVPAVKNSATEPAASTAPTSPSLPPSSDAPAIPAANAQNAAPDPTAPAIPVAPNAFAPSNVAPSSPEPAIPASPTNAVPTTAPAVPSGANDPLGALPTVDANADFNFGSDFNVDPPSAPVPATDRPDSAPSASAAPTTPVPNPNLASAPVSASASASAPTAEAFATSSARVEAATVRIAATENGRNEAATGILAHYNSEAGEALAISCARIFRDVANEDALKIVVDVCDPATGRTTTVPGEKIYCDLETDVALVALRVPFAVRPVSFLPEGDALRVGERAFSFARDESGVRPLAHKVLSVDRHYFQPRPGDERRKPFYYAQVSTAPEAARRGGGLFVERSGRLYWAGVCVAGDAEHNDGFFVPAEVVCRALSESAPLAVALRDQRAGKFDEPVEPTPTPTPQTAQTSQIAQNAQTAERVVASPVPTAVAPEEKIRPTDFASPATPTANDFPDASLVANVAPEFAENAQTSLKTQNAQNAQTSRSVPAVGANTSDASFEELLEAALDGLRRRALEGAEIVCVVGWSDDPNSGAPREAEVVRLPSSALPKTPSASNAANAVETRREDVATSAPSAFPEGVARR